MTPVDIGPLPGATTTSPTVTVTVSAPIACSSLVCATCSPRAGSGVPPEVVDRASAFWGDGVGLMAEFDVLVDAVGLRGSLTMEPVFARLVDRVALPDHLDLSTEPEEDQRRIRARLARLADDADLRARYVDVLREVWATYADEWEARGREESERTAAEWTRRLAGGADVVSLLPDAHIARRQPYTQMARDAARAGRLDLAPTLTGMGHIIALPGRMSIASAPSHDDPVVRRRQAADVVAEVLKPLAEPTRLTILAHLAAEPSGVSDVARALHIAQPTASVHVRKLREAGLLEARRNGATTIYSARPEVVRQMLTRARDRLYGVMTGTSPTTEDA